jgi:hypothetical protein
MKIPTLIVRLIGLYLLATCSIGLFQVQKMQAIAGPAFRQNDLAGDLQIFAWLGLVVGFVATGFAGPLARFLTFDSEPKERSADLSDQLLGRNNKKT